MRKEYDFSQASANPYAAKLKKQITIRLNSDIIDYFKQQSKITSVPYQQLINLYLTECAKEGKKLKIKWE